ncbi:MAG: ATP-binding cassette domain-containing protein [Albidovulum sp.]|nr:ATP-binding cassette domain-containing protein [Albidovulum sp.]MDE0307660.1 ATP-binding cassette domain-containing protein [Albidovulum sp.]MDE0534120.1 ATP-binding cassette domain-containing protein [Albidovulum sp.]
MALRDIKKSFGGVQALRGASIDVARGEVTALVGDNGAGKSTLIKIVMGVHPPTSGSIVLEGREISVPNPEAARSLGIEAIYQDLALVGTFDLAQNFFLGRERMKSYFGGLIKVLDKAAMREEALKVLTERVGIHIGNPYANAYVMSGGQRQAAAIGRAIYSDARLIIMDEPTAALGVEETDRVLAIIGHLRDQGLTVLMVSHNLEHVFRCADSIAVMHRGEINTQVRTKDVTRQDIVAHIMGSRAVA